MHHLPLSTIKRSYSDSSLTRKASSVTRPKIDPFSQFSMKISNTPALKPTCHKTSSDKLKSPCMPTPPSSSSTRILNPSTQPPTKLPKAVPSLNSSIFSKIFSKSIGKKPASAANPAFSAKKSPHSSYALKPILRPSKTTPIPIKQTSKPAVFSKKLLKRVNNFVFKDKSKRYKSALDFSFANPETFKD